MKKALIARTALGGLMALPAMGAIEAFSSSESEIARFFDFNCYECHNDVDRKGGLDLESLPFASNDPASMAQWILVHDRVRDGEMPPRKKSVLDPIEQSGFLAQFEQVLHEASNAEQAAHGRVRLRRLNRIEYENSMHHVLGVQLPIVDRLPQDRSTEGFSNIAEAQQISHHLLNKYLDIIDASLEEAFRRVLHPAAPYRRNFEACELAVSVADRIPNERQGFYHADHAISFPTSTGFHGRMKETAVPETGWYRVKIRAMAHNPRPDRDIWTEVHTGILRAKAPIVYPVGVFQATREYQDLVFDAWIRQDHMLGIRPTDRTLDWVPGDQIRDYTVLENDFAGVAVAAIEMERIHPGLEDREVRNILLGNLPIEHGEVISKSPRRDLAHQLTRFAERAFRRPVKRRELNSYVKFATAELKRSGSLVQALKSGYRAILSSPRFLYFIEPSGPLDDYAIASRLSYFLWSCPPDEELMHWAEAGELSRPDVLAAQVERLLVDPRSEAFVRNFSDDWLNLKDIDFTTPDVKLYREFDEILKHAMLGETRAFLRELIQSNLSVTNVVDSDFTMLNDRIARHYDIAGVRTSDFTKMKLKDGDHRGGILTHASVLKVTANGTTTSPIVRGVWVLERILGEHIPPPPDQVPAIEPDIRGASDIREQLDKHRSSEACMACHRKIDPPGFALENYDVIGGWRKRYRALDADQKRVAGQPVDASYTTADGEFFHDLEDFKDIILAEPEQVARNMMNQILTYATGAGIEFADRREINEAVGKLAAEDYGFRSLIHSAVQTSIFRSK